MTASKAVKDYTGREFVIEREFAAPRELVFQAWTDPKLLLHWWGPKGFTNPVCDWDVRPGGRIHVVMRAPNGTDYPMGGEFREIKAPERLMFTAGALDGQGKLLFEFLHDARFSERNGKTLLTLRSQVIMTTAEANKYIGGFEAGMTQSLERLAEVLAALADGPLVVERVFDAPVALVWRALTTPAEMKEWYFDIPGFKAEPGCQFGFVVEHEGFQYDHRCIVTTVVPGKKLVHTWRYAGHAGDSLVTFELFAEGEQTRLRLTHEGLDTFPRQACFARKNFFGGWTHLIGASLAEYLEKNQAAGSGTADREIVITRVFDAPRELVWEAWTNPEHIIHWYGPQGFTTTIEVMDVRPGGVWKHIMHGPDGTDYPNHSVFEEVVKPERIVFAHGGGKPGGTEATFQSTWTFEAVSSGRTRVTIRMVFPTAVMRDTIAKEYGAVEGGNQTLARLAEFLAR